MENSHAQYYRISPELRRCCWYVVLSIPIIIGFSYWLIRVVQNRGAADFAAGALVYSLLLGWMVIPLRWRLRVNQDGISRRRLFRWDHWQWSDFSSGRVLRSYPYTFLDPNRSLINRRLGLHYLAKEDIQAVLSAISSHYCLSPAPDITGPVFVKYGRRRTLTIDNLGIHLWVDDSPHEFVWRDVIRIEIERMDLMRRDFTTLNIVLPDHEIELRTHNGQPVWKGAQPEQVSEILVRHISTERIVTSVWDVLSSRGQIEKKLKKTKELVRVNAILLVVVCILDCCLAVWMGVQDGLFKAFVMSGLVVLYPGSVLVFVYRVNQRERERLVELLNSNQP